MTLSIFPRHKNLFVLIDVLTPCWLEKLAFGGCWENLFQISLTPFIFFLLAPIFAATVYRIFHIQSFCCANNCRCLKERLNHFFVCSFFFILSNFSSAPITSFYQTENFALPRTRKKHPSSSAIVNLNMGD